jgi:hypothetical protein
MFFDQPAGSGYETFADTGDGECSDANEILVRDDAGKLTPFGQVSPISRVLNRQLMFRRLHVAPQWRDRAEQIVRQAR